MSKEDARKISPEAQRERRRIALRMRHQGYRFTEIAEVIGVHPRRIQEWWRRAQRDGEEAAIEGGRRGRRYGEDRTLSPDEEARIQELIRTRAPEDLGVGGSLWTRRAVATLIETKLSMVMPIRTVGEYLKRWGFTAQRPAKRDYQQDPEQIEQWLEEDYPRLAERARQEGAEIHWGDQTGVRSQTHAGRSYAPCGQTPVVKVQTRPWKVNLMSTLTNQGKVRFMLYEENFNEDVLVDFLRRLIRSTDQKVFLILDNHRSHHSRKVKSWLKNHLDRIEVFYLPPYAPEHNPDEYLNGDLKRSLQDHKTPQSRDELKQRVRSILRTFQRLPGRIKSYFNHPKIEYAK